jgi:hypothetical protein
MPRTHRYQNIKNPKVKLDFDDNLYYKDFQSAMCIQKWFRTSNNFKKYRDFKKAMDDTISIVTYSDSAMNSVYQKFIDPKRKYIKTNPYGDIGLNNEYKGLIYKKRVDELFSKIESSKAGDCFHQSLYIKSKLPNYDVKVVHFTMQFDGHNLKHAVAICFRDKNPFYVLDPWAGRHFYYDREKFKEIYSIKICPEFLKDDPDDDRTRFDYISDDNDSDSY